MKIGDYVRYKNGEIEKIHSFAEKDNPLFNILINARYHNTNEIKKYGEPIDLIEPGDYVNGLKVSRVDGTYHGRKDKAIYCDYCENKETGKWTMIYDDEIKSIVTREQFESMEYKIYE